MLQRSPVHVFHHLLVRFRKGETHKMQNMKQACNHKMYGELACSTKKHPSQIKAQITRQKSRHLLDLCFFFLLVCLSFLGLGFIWLSGICCSVNNQSSYLSFFPRCYIHVTYYIIVRVLLENTSRFILLYIPTSTLFLSFSLSTIRLFGVVPIFIYKKKPYLVLFHLFIFNKQPLVTPMGTIVWSLFGLVLGIFGEGDSWFGIFNLACVCYYMSFAKLHHAGCVQTDRYVRRFNPFI